MSDDLSTESFHPLFLRYLSYILSQRQVGIFGLNVGARETRSGGHQFHQDTSESIPKLNVMATLFSTVFSILF